MPRNKIRVHSLLLPDVSLAEFQAGASYLMSLTNRPAYAPFFRELVADRRLPIECLVILAREYPHEAAKNPQALDLLGPEPSDPVNAQRFIAALWAGWCTWVRAWASNLLVKPADNRWVLAHVLLGLNVFPDTRTARDRVVNSAGFAAWKATLDAEQARGIELAEHYLEQVTSVESVPLNALLPVLSPWIGHAPADVRDVLECSALRWVAERACADSTPRIPELPCEAMAHTRLGKFYMQSRTPVLL